MRALVTGAARGIGRAVADALAAGADVVRCDICPEHDELQVDVRDAAEVLRLVHETGPFDVLVNNAGVVRRTLPTDAWDRAADDFDHVVGTNLRGAFLVGRAVIPGMVAAGHGAIVNVATDHVHPDPRREHAGSPAMDVYDASKWGLVGLTRAWAAALAPHGITVNNLCVGATDTAMLRSFLRAEPDAATVASWLRPADVATIVLALLADGRSGDDVGVWPGHPVALPPPGPHAIRSSAKG